MTGGPDALTGGEYPETKENLWVDSGPPWIAASGVNAGIEVLKVERVEPLPKIPNPVMGVDEFVKSSGEESELVTIYGLDAGRVIALGHIQIESQIVDGCP
jgi:hypothetical protein